MTNGSTQETNEQWLARLLGMDMLLWSPNVQAQAFMHLDRIFATRTIRRGPAPSALPAAAEPLHIEYRDYGKTCSVDDLMRDEHLSGVIVLKGHEVMLERYAMGLTRDTRWQSSSMVKSLASTLVGAAMHDGLIRSLDEPITAYLPDFAGSAYEKVTIRHLLTMSSGTDWVEDASDIAADLNRHYIKPIAQRKAGYITQHLKTLNSIHAPGTQFYYNTGDVFILSLLISKVTGKTVADYCAEKIWVPAGMEQDGYFILDSDDGQEITGSRWGASLRDFARFGLLMLDDGVAGGQRVLPEGWVKEATTPSARGFGPAPDGRRGFTPTEEYAGYGYLWWIPAGGGFMAKGSAGQWIYVDPATDLVIVIVGAMPRDIYMDRDDPALRQQGSEQGGPRRVAFIDAVRKAVR
jgi:CubicO group peptidase (beta-lactamase class C family)